MWIDLKSSSNATGIKNNRKSNLLHRTPVRNGFAIFRLRKIESDTKKYLNNYTWCWWTAWCDMIDLVLLDSSPQPCALMSFKAVCLIEIYFGREKCDFSMSRPLFSGSSGTASEGCHLDRTQLNSFAWLVRKLISYLINRRNDFSWEDKSLLDSGDPAH